MKKTITYKEVKDKVLELINGGVSPTPTPTPTGLAIKSITYVGDGTGENVITFTDNPTLILSVYGEAPDGNWIRLGVPIPFVTHKGGTDNVFTEGNALSYGGHAGAVYEVDATAKTLTFKRDDDIGACFNGDGKTYTVYYV